MSKDTTTKFFWKCQHLHWKISSGPQGFHKSNYVESCQTSSDLCKWINIFRSSNSNKSLPKFHCNMLDFVLSLFQLQRRFLRLLKSKMTRDCTSGNFLPTVSLSVRPWEGSVKLATERPLFCQTISQFLLLTIIIIIIHQSSIPPLSSSSSSPTMQKKLVQFN